jgi:hypothetical protein
VWTVPRWIPKRLNRSRSSISVSSLDQVPSRCFKRRSDITAFRTKRNKARGNSHTRPIRFAPGTRLAAPARLTILERNQQHRHRSDFPTYTLSKFHLGVRTEGLAVCLHHTSKYEAESLMSREPLCILHLAASAGELSFYPLLVSVTVPAVCAYSACNRPPESTPRERGEFPLSSLNLLMMTTGQA